jgi:hypothetical protein
MSKNLLALIDTILASTGRTVRAVALILAVGLVTGAVPGVQLPTREPSAEVVHHAPPR